MYTNMYFYMFIVCLNTTTSMIKTNVFFDFTDVQTLDTKYRKANVYLVQARAALRQVERGERVQRVLRRGVTGEAVVLLEAPHTEQAPTKHGKTEQAHTEHTTTEHTTTEHTTTEHTTTEQAHTEHEKTEQAHTEPAHTEQAHTEQKVQWGALTAPLLPPPSSNSSNPWSHSPLSTSLAANAVAYVKSLLYMLVVLVV